MQGKVINSPRRPDGRRVRRREKTVKDYDNTILAHEGGPLRVGTAGDRRSGQRLRGTRMALAGVADSPSKKRRPCLKQKWATNEAKVGDK